MSAISESSAFAPFRIRSFRFQWPADMATSWAFEMESLILGWYVLVETQSVMLLALFVSLQYTGTFIGPLFGVMGDRIGHRNMLCAMRAAYATLATTLMILTLSGVVTPVYVFIIAGLSGLVRPSDIGMRAAVVGDTMPAAQLMAAMGIQRTTQDSARIAGALTGAGVVALMGMGAAYVVVATLYTTSLILTWKAGGAAKRLAAAVPDGEARASPWRDLKEGLVYVYNTPLLLAVMCLAFLLNLTAFPLLNGLLPYVVKEIYHSTQTELGYMVAGASFGALLGSLMMSRFGPALPAARIVVIFSVVWYLMMFVFSHMETPSAGIMILMLGGFAQSFSQVPMAAILLRNADPQLRGRVMGIRMLAINGNIPGLLISGPLITNFGYPVTAAIYCAVGIVFTVVIGMHWRRYLWRSDAPANKR
ncbi:MAG: arabinose transporter permease [Betaproteobacteria bacterium]|nr:arabinose transporter permease [Betaproteobacteria bacterium]